MQLKLQNGFARKSDPKLETEAFQIQEAMTGNSYFPDPKPTLPEVQAAVTAYSAALTVCTTGDRVKIAEKNECRSALVNILHQLSRYVLMVSNDNAAIALTSGFNISADPVRRELPKPDPLVLANEKNPGEISCAGKTVKGAKSYIFQYATLEAMTTGNWSNVPTTRVKTVLQSLNRGTLYYCRFGAIGGDNQLVYSDVVTRTAA